MDRFFKKEQVVTKDGELVDSKVTSFYNPFDEERGYNFKYKSSTVKSYTGIELPKCFTYSECGKLYRLSKKIYSSSNLLAKRSNNRISPLTLQDIMIFIGVHRVNFKPFWDKIISNKIIKPVSIGEETYFCFNPLYFNATRYMPLHIYTAFQNELKNHLPGWVTEKYLELQKQKEG